MGKHFIDTKSSEILSNFHVFPCTTQIALFWPKLLPAFFLKKPWYLCPFEILEEALLCHAGLGYPSGVDGTLDRGQIHVSGWWSMGSWSCWFRSAWHYEYCNMVLNKMHSPLFAMLNLPLNSFPRSIFTSNANKLVPHQLTNSLPKIPRQNNFRIRTLIFPSMQSLSDSVHYHQRDIFRKKIWPMESSDQAVVSGVV
jgi:hypothetical protein